jgi:arylsulfatase A-like enzyme
MQRILSLEPSGADVQPDVRPRGAAFAIGRVVFALAGAVSAGFVVAAVEGAHAAGEMTGARDPGLVALFLADLGVLAPIAALVGAGVAFASAVLEPAGPVPLSERWTALRSAEPAARARAAAGALLAGLAAVGWLVVTADVARRWMGTGAPKAAGAALAVTSIVWMAAFAGLGVALIAPVRRALAAAASRSPRAIDPASTAIAGVIVGASILGAGACIGDTGGQGPTALAIFGVLRRPELDLWPVVDLAAIAVAAWLAPLALSGRAPRPAAIAGAVFAVAAQFAVTFDQAFALEADPAAARGVEQYAPLGKIALATVRRATDGDHDGASPYFGGGDCDDHNPNISPLAVEIPGNGVDEDCSGADLPLASAPTAVASEAADPGAAAGREYNLIFLTVDTLRAADVGFLGYDKPTTPNLDALAGEGVAFERAYSMASYTGKALAPMMIGKFPSETARDGGHFNRYFASNTFLAERLKGVGVTTFGAASHWYFRPSWGLTQGFDTFDISAIPAEGQSAASDSTTTSEQVTDAALKLLQARAAAGRFFMWVHYFDPHEQYVPHAGAPDFGDPAKPSGWRMHALYDGEVWFTDKHIGRLLDYARSQRWWKDTVVVVTSDHGESMNEHGIYFQHGFEIWEPLVRVPLIIRVPDLPARRVPVKRSVIDVVPTLLDLMRVPRPPPGELSGQSMMDDLTAKAGASYSERDVYIDMPDGPFTHMRRGIIHGDTPGMKLVHLGGRQYQLFDLAADPDEAEDLAADPAKLGPMIDAMQAKRATLREIVVKADVIPGP